MSMNSKLNDAAKKEEKKNIDFKLGFTAFSDDGEELNFPPLANAEYPISISERALREYIARGGAIIEVPVASGKKPTENDRLTANREDIGEEIDTH